MEPVTEEFYTEIYKWYVRALTLVEFPNDLKADEVNHKKISLIRLLTRLLFAWFIKERELVDQNLFTKKEMEKILDWDKDSSYYKAILQNLFFATLNCETNQRGFNSKGSSIEANTYLYQKESKTPLFKIEDECIERLFKTVPFLNGGLFECLDRPITEDEANTLKLKKGHIARVDGFTDIDGRLKIPNELFFNETGSGIIQILERFQFTTRESTSIDIDIALDPELLGKVFENLLSTYETESNKKISKKASKKISKKTGSFYTPREVVSYMVDESLKEHFTKNIKINENKRGKIEDAIDLLFLASDGFDELDNDNKDLLLPLIDTISEIKVLDPAVGSGAFPMGVLQRLVSLLEILDPKNTLWHEKQLEKVEKIDDDSYKKVSKIELDTIFDTENSYKNYSRKLFLINNCIHGVDIQPIAIHISKLRFFISLVTDQKEKMKMKPLPNLEARLISADSLAGLRANVNLFTENMDNPDIKELKKVRSNYLFASTFEVKNRLRDEDRNLRKKIKKILINKHSTDRNIANKISNWDIYNQNIVADWFDSEWMFDIQGGFDIVIGNPPYRQVSRGKYSDTKFPYSEGKDKGKQNLYKLFVEHSYNLCKQRGIATLIVQSSLMCDESASQTRDLLLTKTKIKHLIKFPEKSSDGKNQVFKTVTQGTCILHFSKIEPDNDYSFNISIGNDISTINKLQFTEIKKSEIIKLWSKHFYFPLIKSNYLSIINKIHNNSSFKPLEDYVDGFQQGDINLTIDKKSFSKEPTDVILLRGKHISRYNIDYLNKEEFCNIDYKNCQDRVDENSTGNVLITQHVTGTTNPRRLIVALVQKADKKMIFGNSVNKIIITDQNDNGPVQAILNSKFMDWFLRLTSTNNNINCYELEKLPIPQMSSANKHQLSKYGCEFMNKFEKGEDTTSLDREIDNLVYRLFKLSKEEINTIEKEYSNATVSSKD